ncbi:hypothetical protein DRN87_00560 [Candidatus Geothermarchaeota archaeon]|nr:MAG: hypothetical protein DRN87_00560 [Candidatus Geothermarchaeota archaeon]
MTSETYNKLLRELYLKLGDEDYIYVLKEFESSVENILNVLEGEYLVEREVDRQKILAREKEILRELNKVIKIILVEDEVVSGKNSVTINNLYNSRNKSKIKETYKIGVALQEIPKFRGSDRKLYGPFKPGDIILINEKDFNKLKDKKMVEEEEINYDRA